MPKFTVLCRVDAYVDYVAEVEADDAEDAAYIAKEAGGDLKWEEWGAVEFDSRGYVALDAEGDEIEDSRCGDW
jgi:hypothetical protein